MTYIAPENEEPLTLTGKAIQIGSEYKTSTHMDVRSGKLKLQSLVYVHMQTQTNINMLLIIKHAHMCAHTHTHMKKPTGIA